MIAATALEETDKGERDGNGSSDRHQRGYGEIRHAVRLHRGACRNGRGGAQAGMVLFWLAYLLGAPLVLALIQMTRRRATLLGTVGAVLGVLGTAAQPGIPVVDAYDPRWRPNCRSSRRPRYPMRSAPWRRQSFPWR